MQTAFFSHPDCFEHDTGTEHPESASRLWAINDHLIATGLFDLLKHYDAPVVSDHQLLRVHPLTHLEYIQAQCPETGVSFLDPDTVASPKTLQAAKRAAGAVVNAVDSVLAGESDNAFCCVRPPGHHAESSKAMGFCFYNNVAVGAAHALEKYNLQRIAIIDFDVHQGNGTEEIFQADERVLFCSSFQHPFYPFSKMYHNGINNISLPMSAGEGSDKFRSIVRQEWLPTLERFKPELIFISAGFDAHIDDDMSQINLVDSDYRWVTEQILELAERHAQGRIVSSLEGGYELNSLARSVTQHLRVLMGQ